MTYKNRLSLSHYWLSALGLAGSLLAGLYGVAEAQSVSQSRATPTPATVRLPSGHTEDTTLSAKTKANTKDSAVTLRYAVFVHGIHVLDAEGAYVLRPWGYGGKARLYTIGLASWFLNLDIHAETQGHFDDKGWAQPLEYDSHGLSRKKQRHAHIKFDQDGPHLTLLTPRDRERDPLPEDKLKSSMDILSGLATLFQSLAVTGKCDLSGTLYDGLRLTHIEAHGPFADKIPTLHDSSYSGQDAQRCDFIGYQIAGFPKDSHHKKLLSAPQPGKAWFLTLKDYGIVPVKIQFHHPKAGDIEMVMQSSPATATMVTSDSASADAAGKTTGTH